ncbi:hypothetical protein [Streptomyces sp. I05A-00742]|uniref:hypothetical protein n=1 Tax=Streptomyces sp. I05A-00742 TaxID=2732853 RepID=UPI001487CB5E|nr:hypothetical protein [Streptomyces sp. I05A-00742]
MQANDARTLLQCAVPTLVAGAVAVAIGFAVAGGKGGIGAAAGILLALANMSLGLYMLQRTARQWPQVFQMMGLALYAVQFLVIAVLLGVLKDTTLFNPRAFAFSVLAGTLVWVAAQLRAHMKMKILYVDPEAAADAKKPAPAESPS